MTDPIVKTYSGTVMDSRTDVPDPIVDDPGSFREIAFRPGEESDSGRVTVNLGSLRDDLIGVEDGDQITITVTITKPE